MYFLWNVFLEGYDLELHSDHSPLLVSLEMDSSFKPLSFSFLGIWTLHDGFKSLVQSVWVNSTLGNAMMSCMIKLKWAKQALKVLE